MSSAHTNLKLRRSTRIARHGYQRANTGHESRASHHCRPRPGLTARTPSTRTNTRTATIPPLITDLVCNTIQEHINGPIRKASWARGSLPLWKTRRRTSSGMVSPRKRGRSSEQRQRQRLQTMSLVHPEWTGPGPGPGPAQSAPRGRVDIRSPKVLERFLRSSSCGA